MTNHTHLAWARRWLALLAAGVVTLLLTQSALAHEHREVGEYEMVVGFLNEPAVVEEPNGLSLRISHGHEDDAEPVEGLADTLQAVVIFGDQSMPLELEPAFGQPGAYQADFIPTATGAYTFHLTGSIEEMQIDETFTSSPDTFSEVEDRQAISFPVAVAPVGEVASEASDASDASDTAMVLAIVGLIAGLVGLAVAVVAIFLVRRTSAATAPATPAHELAD